MGCNCAAQKQIEKLHELYGDKDTQKKSYLQSVRENLMKVLAGVIILFLSPFIIGYILYIALFTKEKQISLRKFFGKNKKLDEALATSIIENTNIV